MRNCEQHSSQRLSQRTLFKWHFNYLYGDKLFAQLWDFGDYPVNQVCQLGKHSDANFFKGIYVTLL